MIMLPGCVATICEIFGKSARKCRRFIAITQKKARPHRVRWACGEPEAQGAIMGLEGPAGGARQCLPAIALCSTSHTAPMAAARVVDLRHTAPTVRVGAGLLNSRMVSPRCEPNGDSTAKSGSKVMPSPATTICLKVSRLVARKSSASRTSTRLHTSRAWSRRQWPSSSSSRVWPFRSGHLDGRFELQRVVLRERHGEGLLVEFARLQPVLRGRQCHDRPSRFRPRAAA